MKIKLSLLIITLFTASNLHGQISGNCVTDIILSGYSERAYTSVPVTDQQLDMILKCGIKAPSGSNRQPWKFLVINDETTTREIIKDIVPGNLVIIVLGVESETGATPDFDCGLTTESMFIAAHSLGLGARIYTGPVNNINATRKEALAIPEGYRVVSVLRIGNVDKSVDAVSAASKRKTFEEVVNYK